MQRATPNLSCVFQSGQVVRHTSIGVASTPADHPVLAEALGSRAPADPSAWSSQQTSAASAKQP